MMHETQTSSLAETSELLPYGTAANMRQLILTIMQQEHTIHRLSRLRCAAARRAAAELREVSE